MINIIKSKFTSKAKIRVILSFLSVTSSAICMDSEPLSSTLVESYSSTIVTPPSPTKKAPIRIKQNTATAASVLTPSISSNNYTINNKYASLFLTEESNKCLDRIKIGGIESLLAEKTELDVEKKKELSEIKQRILDQPLQVCNFTDFPYNKMDSHVTVSEIDVLNQQHTEFLSDFNDGITNGAYSIKVGEIKILTSFIGILMDLEVNEKFSSISKYCNALDFFTKDNKSINANKLNLHISLIRYCCNNYKENNPINNDKKFMEKYLRSEINSKTKIGILINNFLKIDCVQQYENYIKQLFKDKLNECQTVESACTILDDLIILNDESKELFLNGREHKNSAYYKKLEAYLSSNIEKQFKILFDYLKKNTNFIFIKDFKILKSTILPLTPPFETAYETQIKVQNFIKNTPDFLLFLNTTKFKALMEVPSKPMACVLEHSILPNSDYVNELVEHLNKSKNNLSDIKIEPKEINTSSSNS